MRKFTLLSKTLQKFTLLIALLASLQFANAQAVITAGAVTGSISACFGNASVTPFVQQFTASGTGLTTDITVTAPANFEVSTIAASGYGESLLLIISGSTVANTVIYIRSAATAAAGAISGNITLASTGATSVQVATRGNVIPTPTVNTITNQTLCNGNTTTAVNFTGTANTYSWANNNAGIGLAATGNGNIPAFTATNTGNTTLTATVSVTPTNVPIAYVANAGSNNVSVINTATNTVTSTVVVEAGPVSLGNFITSLPTCTGAAQIFSITVNPSSNASIATENKIQTLPVPGITYFSNGCTDALIARLIPNGASPISGNTTAKVWIETIQPAQFVKRHYEITPATGAATASSNVTLYFTQVEFDDFNAVNAVKLPTSSADAAGIANLLIEKRSGVSSDGSGLPSTYTGSIAIINPEDADIIWNATQSRWEVSFDVVGFSGFFAKTQAAVLPLTLINFTGSKTSNGNLIQWQTANEINTKSFELERQWAISNEQWLKISGQAALGSGANGYSYLDADKLDGTILYRLKMIDVDGRFTYSNIIKLTNQLIDQSTVYPNPVTDKATLQIGDRKLLKTEANMIDSNGRIIKTILIKNIFEIIDMGGLPSGLYLLKMANGSSLKIIKA